MSVADNVQSPVMASPPGPSPADTMVWIPGGTFQMGSDRHYPEEAPAHNVKVAGFWMSRHTVTNAEFARFIDCDAVRDARGATGKS